MSRIREHVPQRDGLRVQTLSDVSYDPSPALLKQGWYLVDVERPYAASNFKRYIYERVTDASGRVLPPPPPVTFVQKNDASEHARRALERIERMKRSK